ncbi:glycoprotein 3-alpha-L-fucosyltransferase A isoform X1 [Neodiprion virginianus]|uniref:glycoprotein 3-alpha-L-fucosyltransferase A isoform X1 n=1 Tax=Neodiprion virginianus TaxID=2961670 RepID=UPI001EE72B22|nr:glycoprotein 3-alpha-L-fucosyltransferase A isoform X1 [Neodiprion virginianus]XP_046614306.1 glycoprotein 3-alpha-L-fucosyltransferase A isoform X1 [Neodiprion virginianus]XP_046614307.1 glycoprotein 3-alpha-L-fucosyltransferase A isoform X1 [Neodiprion virginianus]XP_046614308.1 glycoprotein 3-alpha-L-fucosyltransferase A isoform X1 [Neodiprion virginianus]XP_046614309.1 glycoprotein 3-alpha-L-fucosyltransferase A isoform X1 [Neodiprion virginianus]XP_046614310.1 glycoprotein 3-alpha-L-fu
MLEQHRGMAVGLMRFSLKRCFLYVLCLTVALFFVLNVRQRDFWNPPRTDAVHADTPARTIPDGSKMKQVWSTKKRVRPKSKGKEKIATEAVNSSALVNLLEISEDVWDPAHRPWYMKDGHRLPHPAPRIRRSGKRVARLWPEEDPMEDRITNQLMYVPPEYNKTSAEQKLKKILVTNGMGEAKPGREIFQKLGCPVDTCTILRSKPEEADLILFKDHVSHPGSRPQNQIWMLYFLECPYHTQTIKFPQINWTATYRRDSDIVAPYERWHYYDPKITQIPQRINYAANKTRKVAWFVSNCHARNQRLQYARELGKYIPVDIYGACGSLRCPRSRAQTCFDMLDTDYKFYLAFENSNCKDYITEKFFVNGLGHNVLPIVMGARPEDYERSSPYRSYIHVDEFESPKELADYLHRLDKDDELYNSYFRWKGTGEFINTYFFCRVCAMLHDEYPVKSYSDVNVWWRGEGVCTQSSWRKHNAPSNAIGN